MVVRLHIEGGSTRYITKSVEQIVNSIDGQGYLSELIALASDAGYEMDVEDLMNVYSVPIASVDDIWLPEIDVRTLTYRNKLQFNVTCKFPTLDNSESYHIKHWMAEWGKSSGVN